MKKDTNKLLQYQSFFWSPDYLEVSAWIEHIPFAFWIIEVLKPKTFVELGVHTGTSYFSFCQAVKRMNIDSVCYGVDSWKGDEHAGFYGDEVFEKVMNHNVLEFSRFSTLVRSTFDEAKEYFLDGSIDLLHIDGLHTYEAVKHDFEAWLPKLSDTGLVLFHDINVREKNFGVFKLWEELKQEYLYSQFDFGHGLGILAIGKIVPELNELFNKIKNEAYYTFLRNMFSERGNFFKINFYNDLTLKQEKNNINALSEVNVRLSESQKALELHNAELNENNRALQGNLQALELTNRELKANYKELVARNEQLKKEFEILATKHKQQQEKYESGITELSDRLRSIESSFNDISAKLSATEKEKELFKKDILWYRATYETRSMLGVLKEKIMSKFKKKIVLDVSQNYSSSKTFPDQKGDNAISTGKRDEHTDAWIAENELPHLNDVTPATDTLRVKYQANSPSPSDVCLFSSFSFSGKVEEYVYYYLGELKRAGFSSVFISTSPLEEACISRLSQYTFLIIERENRCPDFGSWKAGLSMLDWGKNLNSVLLTNDSVFGPLFDLSGIISSMNNKYDVWGMSDNHEIDYHLQSYFLYFKRNAVASEVFKNFWKNVDLSATKDEVIHKYEIGLSRLFRKTQFRLGAHVNVDIVSKGAVHGHKVVNPLLVFWKSLIIKYQFPFFKRELIIKRNITRTYDDHRDLYVNVGGWKRVITQTSSYPTKYIEDFMSNYYKVVKANNSDIALSKKKVLFLSDTAEDGENQRWLLDLLQWLKDNTDVGIEILICQQGTGDQLAAEFAELGIVTDFYALSGAEKTNLKKRLINEIALVFSNTIKNLEAQKYLSFLDVQQVIYVHEPSSTLRDILSANGNAQWIKENMVQLIVSEDSVRTNLVKYAGVDEEKVQLVPQCDTLYTTENVEKEYQEIIGHSFPTLHPDPLTKQTLNHYNNGAQSTLEEATIQKVAKNVFTTDKVGPTILQVINKYYDNEELRLAEEPVLAFITHIYYENSWKEIRDKLKNFCNGKNYFLFSISEGCIIKDEIIEDIRKTFDNAFFLITPNVGRDIGGKMALIDLYLLLGIKSSYIVILHDKQSLHSLQGESWKNDLFKIFDVNSQPLILDLFTDPKVGVVGVKDYIINEYNPTTDNFRNNNQLSKKLLKQFGISIGNYEFMGGCIFWIKSSIIEKFFMKNNPILIRSDLEPGNVLDLHGERLTHTWERMFSWIAINDGYRIDGI